MRRLRISGPKIVDGQPLKWQHARMNVRFGNVAVGAAFWCQGKPSIKLALSMAEDAEPAGDHFLDDVMVAGTKDGQTANRCPANGTAV
jgi:hypothetical protein